MPQKYVLVVSQDKFLGRKWVRAWIEGDLVEANEKGWVKPDDAPDSVESFRDAMKLAQHYADDHPEFTCEYI